MTRSSFPPLFGTWPRRVPKLTWVLGAGLVGAAWGLALARALAETWPGSPTFYWGPTLVVALASGGVAAVLAARKRLSPAGSVPLLLPTIYLFWSGVAPTVGWTLLGGSLGLTVLLAGRRVILLYLLAGITLALYVRTLGPTVGQADTFEFQVVAPTLGVAHPTGYPLYILTGKLFSLLPLGSVAWRVNLTSAVFATGAILLLFIILCRLIDQPSGHTNSTAPSINLTIISFLAALALAFSRVFWSQAVVAEVYALHNLFVAAILLLLVGWLLNEGKGRLLSRQRFYLLALLLGLSFANHLTTALMLPAMGLTLWLVRPRFNWRIWLTGAGLFLLGLSLYLYIFFRWPMLHDGTWMSWGEFWRYVTGQQFGGALRLDAWRTDPTRYEIVGRLLREPFGWPGLVLGVIGLAWLTLKRWRVALITGVTFWAFVGYALSYYVPDVSVFLLPAHLLLAVGLGVGAAALARGVAASVGDGKATFSVALSLFSLLPLGLLWTNLPRVDQSGEREAFVWGDRLLDLPLEREAVILADSARVAPLYYLQRIQGRRPDLEVLVLADEATYRAELQAHLSAGRTVYLARFLPGLEGSYHLRSLGPLTEVGTAPLTEPPPLDRVLKKRYVPSPAQPETQIELLGLTGPTPGPDGGVGLSLYWRADAPIGQVYHVRLRLVDEQGHVWWSAEGRHPVNNYYPTPAWRPGEVVVDYHEISPLAAGPAPSLQKYTVQVGLFQPFGEEGLRTEQGQAWISLLQLDGAYLLDEGTQNSQAPLSPLRARVGEGMILTGVDLPEVVGAGAPVDVALYWYTRDVSFSDPPTLDWIDAQGVRTEAEILEWLGPFRLTLRAPAVPGAYRLYLALPARCGWLAPPTKGCVVAQARVSEAGTSALANFDGKILLQGAELGASTLRPGQNLAVTLRWEGLRPMAEDYTVSVQLVGPDGRLYGQTDAWPVQGTLPTSQWSAGQRVIDPYQVTLSPGASPGQYRVGVVVYLLETETRLFLLDASGRAIGNIAWIGEVTVEEP